MENVKQLRTELSGVFNQVKSGEMEVQTGKALVATSNAMLKSAQLELEHSKMVGSEKEIGFLKTD